MHKKRPVRRCRVGLPDPRQPPPAVHQRHGVFKVLYYSRKLEHLSKAIRRSISVSRSVAVLYTDMCIGIDTNMPQCGPEFVLRRVSRDNRPPATCYTDSAVVTICTSSLVVTICTNSLKFNNSTFCPHSVFMCFVWI
jgi:hypothetical protein